MFGEACVIPRNISDPEQSEGDSESFTAVDEFPGIKDVY